MRSPVGRYRVDRLGGGRLMDVAHRRSVDVTLDLGRLNVLGGSRGAGKTNLPSSP
jgi:hypothetical protein